MGTLYIVATPIGNLEDITLRAIRILKEVDLILCEDTRTTKRLLDKYEIATKTASYHTHSTQSKEDFIIRMLEEGKSLALVSDAGTPTISDPGVLLVEHVYNHFGDTVQIIPIPGASAVIAALSASGLPSSDFLFLGFLPHKKGRQTLFAEIAASERTVVFYESTHRILKALESLKECLAEERMIVVARELTKHFESIKKGTAKELLAYFESKTDEVRGEFVVIVEAKDNSRKKNSEL